jgi:MFS family permease
MTPLHGVAAPGFRHVLAVREFRVLWLVSIQSLLGDQIARVALAVLVFDRTHSGFATATVYALTFAPAVAGNILLGPLTDRLPRRSVLVAGDLIRAGLLAAMAIPALPLPALAALLVVAVTVGAPWGAAESALIADILTPTDYPIGLGLRSATNQSAQLIGFAAGGLGVAALGAHTALAVNATTFAISALVIRTRLHPRPTPVPSAHTRTRTSPDRTPPTADTTSDQASTAATAHHPADMSPPAGWLGGARAVLRDHQLRLLLSFSWILGLIVVPEGLAAPYAAELNAGPTAVGVLLAAGPTGVLLGTLAYTRLLTTSTRARLLGPFATATGIPLILCATHPGLLAACGLLAAAGTFTGYQIQVVTEFVTLIPAQLRGQGIALASAGLLTAQGLGLLTSGALTQYLPPSLTIATAGATATTLGALLALNRTRQHRHHRHHPITTTT